MGLSAAGFGETLRQAEHHRGISDSCWMLRKDQYFFTLSWDTAPMQTITWQSAQVSVYVSASAFAQNQGLLKTNLLTFEHFSENLNTITLPRSILQVLPVLSAAC